MLSSPTQQREIEGYNEDGMGMWTALRLNETIEVKEYDLAVLSSAHMWKRMMILILGIRGSFRVVIHIRTIFRVSYQTERPITIPNEYIHTT